MDQGENGRRTEEQKILLVDDHVVFRQGLSKLINSLPDYAVAGEAETLEQAISALQNDCFSVAVVDLGLGGKVSTDAIEKLKSAKPELIVIALSMREELEYVEQALRAGAVGYISKYEAANEILPALNRVLRNKKYISETIKQRIVRRMALGQRTSLDIQDLSN